MNRIVSRVGLAISGFADTVPSATIVSPALVL
jgi:hypothetical protein